MNLLLKEMFCVVFYTNRTYKYFESVDHAKQYNPTSSEVNALTVFCSDEKTLSSVDKIGKEPPPSNINREQFLDIQKKLFGQADSIYDVLENTKKDDKISQETVNIVCNFAISMNYCSERAQ
jgi:hypothetical protein